MKPIRLARWGRGEPTRIIRTDGADNFGTIGPCSEIYYNFKPELDADGFDLECGNRSIELCAIVLCCESQYRCWSGS